MKNKLIFLLIILYSSAWSQSTIDVFETKTMTFYGLDFSLTKCIDSDEFPPAEEVIHEYFPLWNSIFMTDDYRVDIARPFKMKEVIYDTSLYAINAQIDASKLIINNAYQLERSAIKRHIQNIADYNTSGLGLVYIVEALNADAKYVSIWLTFFDMKTGEVLLTEPVRAKGKGRRFRDYWTNALLDIYDENANDFKAWKKVYH